MLQGKVVKRFGLGLLCLGLLFIPLKSYIHAGIPYTHDGENHLARFANYKLALKEGQFPPRFAPNLMNRYGYPVFNYNYPLPSIISLPFSWLKLEYSTTFKLIVGLSILAGMIGMLVLGRHSIHSPYSDWLLLTLYVLNPYFFSAILFRGSIGEVISYGLFPWVWWWVKRLTQPIGSSWFIAGSFLIAAFLLAHNVGVLIGVPLLLVLSVIEYGRNWHIWRRAIPVWLTGIGLSLWFWLPALVEKSAIVLDKAGLSNTAFDHIPYAYQLLFSVTQFGFSYLGKVDSLGFSLGLLQVICLILLSLIWMKYRTWLKLADRKSLLGGLGLVWMLIAAQLPPSQWLWNTAPFIQFIQFPWRLSLFLAIILAYQVSRSWWLWPKWGKYLVILVAAVQLIYLARLKPVDYRYLTNNDYDNFTQSTTTANENLPIHFTYLNIGDWQPTVHIIEGAGEAKIGYWKGSDRLYTLQLSQPSLLVEPTMFFPGWQTTVASLGEAQHEYTVEYVDSVTIGGRIAYRLSPGNYQIRTQFTQWTPARLAGNAVSLLTAGGVLGWWIWLRIRGRRPKQL